MRLVKICKNAGITLLLSCVSSIAYASGYVKSAQFDSILRNWQVKHQVPTLSFEMVHNGKAYCFVNNLSTNSTKLSSGMLFEVGSITKTFVAAATLKLQEQNKLNTNDKINQYLPQYPRWKNITIEQLLNMTSGISDYFGYPKLGIALVSNKVKVTNDELIDWAYNQDIKFNPGAKFDYSNTNYLLLSKIVETVTKQKTQTVLQNLFFKPLHLKNTYFSETQYPTSVLKHKVQGYHNNINVTNIAASGYGAAGGMLMSSSDIYEWIDYLLIKKTVLSDKSLNAMIDKIVMIPNSGIRPNNTGYGLGILVTNNKQLGKIIWYTGVTLGYSSAFIYMPSRDLTIVAQINQMIGKGIQNDTYNFLFPNGELMQAIIKKETSYTQIKSFCEICLIII